MHTRLHVSAGLVVFSLGLAGCAQESLSPRTDLHGFYPGMGVIDFLDRYKQISKSAWCRIVTGDNELRSCNMPDGGKLDVLYNSSLEKVTLVVFEFKSEKSAAETRHEVEQRLGLSLSGSSSGPFLTKLPSGIIVELERKRNGDYSISMANPEVTKSLEKPIPKF